MVLSWYYPFLSLLCNSLASAYVSCGGHSATTCTDCPYNTNDENMGEGWCNEDCTWTIGNECVAVEVTVRCGNGSDAPSCAECPSDKTSCDDTDCTWHTTTNLCRDAFSNDVRTASVHLNYNVPGPSLETPAWWFQRVIPTALAPATYMASNDHKYGYGGIQQVNYTTGKVLFSLWDQAGCDQDVNANSCDTKDIAETIACGEGVECESFGGEGTGRKSSYTREPFILEKPYYFVTQAAYLGNKRMEYTGYFYEDDHWRLLSRIQVSTDSNEQWCIKSASSFVEQWTNTQTTDARAALFGPSYMSATDGRKFYMVNEATFSHGTIENHEHVNAWQVGPNMEYAVGIETGGDVEQEATRGTVFTYKEYAQYQELTSFQSSIGCLNKADNKEEIESCLKVSCGGHKATTCAACPYADNDVNHGKSWCNGDCTWTSNKCVSRSGPYTMETLDTSPSSTIAPSPTMEISDTNPSSTIALSNLAMVMIAVVTFFM